MTHTSHLARLLITTLVVAIPSALTADNAFDYPPTASLEEVRRRVEAAPKSHPRLLASAAQLAALRQSVEEDRIGRAVADHVVEQAEHLLSVPPIERKKTGRRLLGQSRRCLKRTVALATAYHLTGKERYVRRCEKEMLAVSRFTDWNPSHFLDVAEMTFALALGYDWLHDQLGSESREVIRQAIIEKGVSLPFETRHRGWVDSTNNWGQVCHGGLTAGALAVLEDAPDLAARTVHNALQHVPRSMKVYTPRGSYPEGPGYWSYGTTYNVLLIAALESVLETDFGLSRAPGFRQTGQYPSLVTGSSGHFFNYADGGASRRVQPALFWFAARYERPDWLLGERRRLLETIASARPPDAASRSQRFLPLILLWRSDIASAAEDRPFVRMPLSFNGQGDVPITVHRSSWTDPAATFVGLKGGSPSANHGQMDIGSFVLDADGVRWAVDLGAEGYHGIESRGMNLWSRKQDSDRWTIFRQTNHGHNTLVIDGELQRASGRGEVVEFSGGPGTAYSILGMSSVYQGQATSVRRGVALLSSGEVLVQDELDGLEPGSRVRWGMITPGDPEDTGETNLQLRAPESVASLTCAILSPRDSAWRVIDTATPRNEWDSPNPGTRMLAFDGVAPDSGRLTLAVLATPGSCQESLRDEIELLALKEWDSLP